MVGDHGPDVLAEALRVEIRRWLAKREQRADHAGHVAGQEGAYGADDVAPVLSAELTGQSQVDQAEATVVEQEQVALILTITASPLRSRARWAWPMVPTASGLRVNLRNGDFLPDFLP
jgi:hypothetical protein